MSSPESTSTESTSSANSLTDGLYDSQRHSTFGGNSYHGRSGRNQIRPDRRSSNAEPPSRYYRGSPSHAHTHEPPLPPPSEMRSEARRQSLMAIDRKRRLTESAHETGRRRNTNGGFSERSDRFYDGPSSSASLQPHGNVTIQRPINLQHTEVIDLTNSPPARETQQMPSQSNSIPSDGSRVHVVPKWQPDSEVSECPICRRQFSLLFRRHHCRKCGRVVCNDCSPHRITIPRQFIVHPPGIRPNPDSFTNQNPETVDLTGDDDEGEQSNLFATRRAINPALGGGEKVRLCNPCVPDPQPDPQLNYNLSRQLPTFPGSSNRILPMPLRNNLSNPPVYSHGSLDDRQMYVRRGRQHPFQPHPGNRLHFAEEEEHEPESLSEAFNQAPRQLPTFAPHSRYPGYNAGHSRYHSLDINRPPPSLPPPPFLSGNRPRVRSMLDPFPYHPRITSTMPAPPPPPASTSTPIHRPPRPRVREEDICPICRGLLPPKGPDGDETARENHIMGCITRYDASTPSNDREQSRSESMSLSQSPNPTIDVDMPSSSSFTQRIPMQMLRFVATEKDCIGEDGNPQECSICMVEYDVGDQLVRLECWCKFHQECLVEWFGRKRECPVHKIA